MLSKNQIRKEIEKVSSSYSDEELFSSKYFYRYLEDLVNGAIKTAGINRKCYLTAEYSPMDNTTAYTDGEEVHINTAGPLIREIPTKWSKYVNIVGHIIHECGHIIFTDFIAGIKRFNAWDKCSFDVSEPSIEGIDIDNIKDYLAKHPNYKKIYISAMKDIDNVLEDVYIENRLFEKFDGVATIGLVKKNEEGIRQLPTKQEMFQQVLDGKLFPIHLFTNILLTNRKYNVPLKDNGEKLSKEAQELDEIIIDAFNRCSYEIDEMKYETSGKKRTEYMNSLFCKLMYLLPEPPEGEDYKDPAEEMKKFIDKIMKMIESMGGSPEEGEGTPLPFEMSGSESDYSDEEADEKSKAGEESSKKSGATPKPMGSTAPAKTGKPDKSKAEESKKEASEASEETCKHEVEKASKETAKKEVLECDEKNHLNELRDEAKEIDKKSKQDSNCAGNSYFTGTKIQRAGTHAATENQEAYYEIFKDVEQTSNRLAKKISNILNRFKEEDSPISGFLMGPIFNAKDVYHNDGKYFSRIKEPDGKIKVCFSVLVDESGSMGMNKSSIARKATILLENTLRKLEVPFNICGHTEFSGECTINAYVDFDTNDGNDKYRLVNIDAYAGNIDGAAINYMCEKLMKRPEDIKILIVISDGLPAGTSYFSSRNSNEDTQLAIAKCRKNGIKVFGAVVDQWELVSNLYGNEYAFDARDEGELEKTFVKLIKKYCLIGN